MKKKAVDIMDLRGTYKGGGGPDKTILNSAALHNTEKVNVLVAYLRQPSDNEFKIDEMAHKLSIDYVDVLDRFFVDPICIYKIRKILTERNITLLHTHDDKTLLYGTILKLITPSLRIMHTCHSHSNYRKSTFMRFIEYLRYTLRKKIQVFLMQFHMKPILTISKDTKRRLSSEGINKNDIFVLYNGIDIKKWSPEKGKPILRDEFNISKDTFIVGTVARITFDKDLPTFYKTAKLTINRFPNIKFIIVGDGYGDELYFAKKEVEFLNLENSVYFSGHRTDLENIYASFDIFLMTSRTEGLPNTVLEAMAMEVPVVSTSVGGVPEIINSHSNGILCPVGDANALSDALCCLLKNSRMRYEIAKNSRTNIENNFCFYNRVRKLEELYLKFGAN